ncbi:MAG: hypothetical protein VX320_01595 [Candidatus Thermoplasmatota archaeon]|nr:hypothetical protein [Candidatus Thermoplasmatota archaeon]
MSVSARERLHLPYMRANPFSTRPIEADDAELLVGRSELMANLSHHLRFGGPRLMILQGERGTGRTSILHALGIISSNVHHLSMYPEENPAQTLLNELYCLIAGYDVPGVTSTLVEQLVSSLEGRTGDLPLISFDFPGTNGAELAQVFERLTPVLTRLRALVIVALTPAQMSAWSEDLKDSYHVSEPLSDFNSSEIRALIDCRMKKVSNEAWAVESTIISEILSQTGGRPSNLVRHLRDMIDSARGVSTPLSRRQETLDSMDILPSDPPAENDARQRMAPEISEVIPLDVEDETIEDTEVMHEEAQESFEDELEEMGEDEGEFDFEIHEIDEFSGDEVDSETNIGEEESELEDGLQGFPSLEVEDIGEPDMTAAFGGGTALEMESGTEPPVTPFGGLKNRHRSAMRDQGLEDALSRRVPSGPLNAKPDTSLNISNVEPEIDSDETAYWVADELPEPLPVEEPSETEQSTQPVMDPEHARSIGDALRAQRPSSRLTEIANPLDIERISNLDEREILIVEAATAREVSPSDQALQAHLSVGRPRLSQIFNGLQKAGILMVRKKGRSRLFRLSDAAKAHLSGGHMEA